MKRLIMILSIAFFLLPLAASADPENQPVSFIEEEQAQNTEEAESVTVSDSEASVRESSSERWHDEIQEIESNKGKEGNLEETKEAVAEDIILK